MSSVVIVLRLSVVLCMAAAMGLFVYAIASAPTRIAGNLGLRGLKRKQAIEEGGAWAQIEPLIRWFGTQLGRFLSDETRARINRQLEQAGDLLGVNPEEYIALCILSGIGGLGFGVVIGYGTNTGGGLAVAVCCVLGTFLPYLGFASAADDRLKHISRALPGVIDLLALSMGAGLDFPGSVRQVIEKSSNANDPIVQELMLILQALSLGRTRRDALLEFGRRADVDTVREFVNAVVQAEEKGNPVAEVLAIQAGVSRQRRSVRAEEAAAKAGVKLLLPLLLVFMTVLIILLAPAVMSISESFK